MKWSGHRSLLTIVLTLWCASSFCQKFNYDVMLFGGKIGETTIELKDSAGFRHYTLRSKTEAKMLFVDKKSSMCTDVLFDQAGKMLSSFFQNVKDDETLLTKAIASNDGKVEVDINGTKAEYPGPVNFTSILLYFGEPKNMQRVFSERVGKFFEMVRQNDGTYITTLDGHSAVYTYKAGKLVLLEMKSTLGSVMLKLVQ